MIESPFNLLTPYRDHLQVRILQKADNVHTDEEIKDRLAEDRIVSLHQVHGATALVLREPSERLLQADGVLTDTKSLTLTIRSADCQTFLVYAPEHQVLGVMHVGWRGLVAGMIPSFFKKLQDEWNIEASETLVCAGPSLCQQCAEFSDPVSELPTIDPKFFDGRLVDLQGAATQQLLDIGVDATHIERNPDCTKCENERWWSYRGGDREQVISGYTNVIACTLM